MTAELILALDYGGTKHTVGVIGVGERQWRAQRRIFAPAGADAAYDLETTLAAARALLAGRQPVAIGASFGGPTDHARGVVVRSDHVPGWERVPLQALLEGAFAAPAGIDNDANAGALGEHRYGAGQGVAHLLYVTVSTGVGGGWILNGAVWRGADGLAGEIGHTVVDPAGALCGCGKRGCVERLAAGPFMAGDAAVMLAAEPGRGAILRRLAGQQPLSGQLLSEAAAQGDDVAREILQRGAAALGLGIGNAANLMNPQRVVLGGGVTKAGELWWETVRQVAQATLVAGMRLAVVPAGLGDDAPLWGAVALAEARLGQQGRQPG